MRARFVLLSLGKELRETIRDRRTLAMMIFVPLVAYPLMALVGGQVVASKTRSQEARPSIVAVAGDHPAAAELKTRLDGKRTVFSRQAQGSQADVDSGSLDALVSLSGAGTGPAKAEIVFDATRDEGRQAEARLNDELTGMWPTGCAPRFSIESRDVAPKSRMGGYILSKILPMMILMMVLLGAFYPAIDLTAGERERGTLETVLVAPFRRSDLLLGKVLAVTILATLTGFLNLGSMSVTIVQVVNLAAPEAIVPVPFARAAATGLVILPMAFLFSSVFVAVGSLARGFKEAQNLLMPVYFVLVVPAMLGMMGELPLSSRLALLPGLNVTLLARDIALGKATLEHTVAVLMVTLAWAGLALVAATRFYVSERFINVGDPGQNKRRGWLRFGRGEESGAVESTARREPPTAGEAGVLFALGFLALLFVFFPLQRENMVKGLIITQWGGLFAGCLLYAIYTRRHMLTLLGFRRPGGHALTGAILMGLGGWMIANLVSQWAFPPSKEYLEAFRKLLITETRGLGTNLLLFALTPALCEELFFRGVIMRGLLTRMTPAGAIGMSAAMFAVFHVDIHRLLPTALLGVMLGFIAYRAGSWLASALAHFLNNGILLVLGETGLDRRLESMSSTLQIASLVTAGLLVVAGAVWLLRLPVPREAFDAPEVDRARGRAPAP